MKGKVTKKILNELKRLQHTYKPTKCYLVSDEFKEEIDCVDLANKLYHKVLDKDFLICNERLSRCYRISKDSKLECIEVIGHDVYILKDELEDVDVNERISYIVTNKGEVRSVKSPYKGKLLLIHEVLGEKYSHYRIFIEVKDSEQ